MAHPKIQLLERAADSLGELLDQFVFVGGSTTVLMISDPAAPPSRASIDIDAIVRLETRADYYRLGQELRERGIVEDQSGDAPLCRWRLDDLVLDVMPTEETVLGFTNGWYKHTIATAQLNEHRRGTGQSPARENLPPVPPRRPLANSARDYCSIADPACTLPGGPGATVDS